MNGLVEPLVRAGLGNSLAGPGTFVIETTGRRSGQSRRVPLLAKRVGDTIIVSTIRDNSQWIRNLEHDPNGHVWIAGRPRPAAATIIRLPGATLAYLRLGRPTPHRSKTEDTCSPREGATWRTRHATADTVGPGPTGPNAATPQSPDRNVVRVSPCHAG